MEKDLHSIWSVPPIWKTFTNGLATLHLFFARLFSEAQEEQCFNISIHPAPAFRPFQQTTAECADGEQEMRKTCVATLVLEIKAVMAV